MTPALIAGFAATSGDIYVPDALVGTYKTAANWVTFADLAEQQLREGSASAMVITHLLKLRTTEEHFP